jgi:hypothetical protein
MQRYWRGRPEMERVLRTLAKLWTLPASLRASSSSVLGRLLLPTVRGVSVSTGGGRATPAAIWRGVVMLPPLLERALSGAPGRLERALSGAA